MREREDQEERQTTDNMVPIVEQPDPVMQTALLIDTDISTNHGDEGGGESKEMMMMILIRHNKQQSG